MSNKLSAIISRRARMWRTWVLLALIMPILFTINTLLSDVMLLRVTPSFFSPYIRRQQIRIWQPVGRCVGNFTSSSALHSKHNFPYIVIRDAVVDRRPVSLSQFHSAYPDVSVFRRVILFASVHLSVIPTMENAVASMLLANASQAPVNVHMDYVVRADPSASNVTFENTNSTAEGSRVSEWQIALSLSPKQENAEVDDESFAHLLHSLSEAGSIIHISLQLLQFDGEKLSFSPSFSLACITGWEHPSAYRNIRQLLNGPVCYHDAHTANSSIVYVGNVLRSEAKGGSEQYEHVAHFVARALVGPVKFDTVCMSVITNHSVADISKSCAGDITCENRLHSENIAELTNIRDSVEMELEKIGFNNQLFNRVLFLPFCRLGSDADKNELGDACGASFQYGRFHSSYLSYTMLAPFYKWAASYNVDEFLASTPPSENGSSLVAGHAHNLLDTFDGDANVGHMFFPSLHFTIRPNSMRNLTRDLWENKAPFLRVKEGEQSSENCLDEVLQTSLGRSAVRCDVGLGFGMQLPVLRKESKDRGTLEQEQGKMQNSKLRTWQASDGMCEYVDRDEDRHAG